jgi:Domain of unknown function (DUF4878)
MKKLFSVLAILSLTLFVSCSGGGTPESVAEKFLAHMSKGEMDEAKKYCDKDTATMLGEMGDMTPEQKEEMKKMDVKIEVISSDVKDETAVVKYKVTNKGETSPEQSMNLKKVDGDWKVTK